MSGATLERLIGAAKLLASDNQGEAEAARRALIRMAMASAPPRSLSPSEAIAFCLSRADKLKPGERPFLMRLAGERVLLRDDLARLRGILQRAEGGR